MSGGTYDFVVMGGGHNGLLGSIYLAKAGYKVCVLEALDEFGGGTRSGEIAPGYIADQGGHGAQSHFAYTHCARG